MVRCFAALPVPDAAREALARALHGFRDQPWPVRWVRPEGVHVTLKFFGETAKERIDAIAESLDYAAEGIGPIPVTLNGFGAFPGQDRARVLWAGVDAPAALELLQDRIETRAESLGFPTEGNIYRPHVTVGRVREGERLAREQGERLFGAALDTTFSGDRVVLYESHPGPGGSTYSPLHTVVLRG